MSEKIVTVYVTKYALTAGITRQVGCVLTNNGHYVTRPMNRGPHLFEVMGRDAFFTEAEAVERAKAMAEAKLKSLRAQQSKVSKLLVEGFKVKDGKS